MPDSVRRVRNVVFKPKQSISGNINMKNITAGRRKRRSRHLAFNPNHEFIAEAVEEYLSNGGQIKQIEAQKEERPSEKIDEIPPFEDIQDVDEFLRD